MSFNVGDTVRTKVPRHTGPPAGDVGTVTTSPWAGAKETTVEFEGLKNKWFYLADQLELVEPQFVNVTTTRSIWITLPGSTAGQRLTEDEARALFRQLEEVV